MKSDLISVIRTLHFHKSRPNLNHISKSVSSSPPHVYPTRKISTLCRTYGSIFRKTHLLEKPSRIVCTLVEDSSMRKEKTHLEEAFEDAKTIDERVRLFKEMESSLEKNELGLSALILGIHLYGEGEDPQKILYYAHKAIQYLDDKPSLLVSMSLLLMGTANFALNRLSHSVKFLDRASQILVKLETEFGDNDVGVVLRSVEDVYYAMGEQEEAIEDSLNSLGTKEMTLEEDSKELGVANRCVADAFAVGFNFEAALPYALHALEIHRKELVNNLVEIAQDRRLLGVIYSGLKQHDNAMEQNQWSQNLLKNLELFDGASIEVALGQYEEEIAKGVAKQTEKDNETRALVLISMSKALVNQRKFTDAVKSLEFVCGLLEKKERTSPLQVVEAYSEIAMQYESMNEFEKAILLLQKTLCILEKLPREEHSVGSVYARIGWLLLFSGRVSQAVLYLESAAERLKESFGARHFRVGYVYNNLGAAYLDLNPLLRCLQWLRTS